MMWENNIENEKYFILVARQQVKKLKVQNDLKIERLSKQTFALSHSIWLPVHRRTD